ncbi:hypothetical protein ACA910_009270 [Epithemia clementina (nom. ined.)]
MALAGLSCFVLLMYRRVMVEEITVEKHGGGDPIVLQQQNHHNLSLSPVVLDLNDTLNSVAITTPSPTTKTKPTSTAVATSTTVSTTTTTTIPTNESALIEWKRDSQWFNNLAKRGCCPYAQKLYNQSYAYVGYRCCQDRLDRIAPLRPVGGLTYSKLMERFNNAAAAAATEGNNNNKNNNDNNTNETFVPRPISILIQGDSLAEQHYLALLCHAWYETNVVDFDVTQERFGVDKNNRGVYIWNAVNMYLNLTLMRWEWPSVSDHVNYQEYDYVYVGGWHHGGSDRKTIQKFLSKLDQRRKPTHNPTFAVQATPTHYRSDYDQRTLDCSLFYNTRGSPNVNDKLPDWTQNMSSVQILEVAYLYFNRSDAHVGKKSRKGQDCIHWCVAPGVLDAMAQATLASLTI